ncbi:hypothetical protein [Sphaerisporangium rhizosphaerae]|uniref:Uncharacterized protein n=1 Tax=Sphaerisporangium rhizosphaerae TaxID=2269375 RepID=A0ABW2PE44_9ACTN
MVVRRLTLVLASLPVLALAGCGGQAKGTGVASADGGASGGPAASASPATSSDPLKFAQCMREHGVDMKDPDPDGRIQMKIDKGQQGKMEAAQKACGKYMQGGKRMDADDPKRRDAMLRFARCMREHGVDMADPKPGEGILIRMPKPGSGGEEKVKAAQKACEHFMGGGMGG